MLGSADVSLFVASVTTCCVVFGLVVLFPVVLLGRTGASSVVSSSIVGSSVSVPIVETSSLSSEQL